MAEVSFHDVIASAGPERERLIGELVRRMTLREKIKQMSGSAGLLGLGWMLVAYGSTTYDSGRNKLLGIPAIKFTDGPRGVCLGRSTCFPVPMARGATWDVDLQRRIGSCVGIEARAQGANFYGGVCINVPRHPGWGRSQETFGEDTFHLGEMGAATVEGAQEHLMACAKHLACNSMEEARFFVDVRIGERTLREIYLPHFEKCVRAGVASIMSAYNMVNGDFCGHNPHLLRGILKDEWGFDGLVMSDFVFGVRDGKKGANAGLDVEMPARWRYGLGFKGKVRRGKVPASAIDDAVTRVLRQKARFAQVGAPGSYTLDAVAGPEHTQLALETARKSIVLLKNAGKALPLDTGAVGRLAVIGKLARRANIGDMGSSRVNPPYVVTPLEGIEKIAGGSVEVAYDNGRDLDRAKRVSAAADAVVVVVGLTRKDEGEFMPVVHTGGDREDLGLPRRQEDLIRAVAGASDRCIVILEGGSAILTTLWQDEVEAILMAWYPGMEGGSAIAEILFGQVNPSGKLPVTFPAANDQNPPFDKKAKSAEYGYYHGYRLFDKEKMEPAFPFGHGLSYTRFEFKNLSLSSSELRKKDTLTVSCKVTNAGNVQGAEVVQVYVGCKGSRVDRAIRELKGFSRIELEPGETKTVTIELEVSDLAYYDESAARWMVEETDYTVYAGSSSREADLPLRATFTVLGD